MCSTKLDEFLVAVKDLAELCACVVCDSQEISGNNFFSCGDSVCSNCLPKRSTFNCPKCQQFVRAKTGVLNSYLIDQVSEVSNSIAKTVQVKQPPSKNSLLQADMEALSDLLVKVQLELKEKENVEGAVTDLVTSRKRSAIVDTGGSMSQNEVAMETDVSGNEPPVKQVKNIDKSHRKKRAVEYSKMWKISDSTPEEPVDDIDSKEHSAATITFNPTVTMLEERDNNKTTNLDMVTPAVTKVMKSKSILRNSKPRAAKSGIPAPSMVVSTSKLGETAQDSAKKNAKTISRSKLVSDSNLLSSKTRLSTAAQLTVTSPITPSPSRLLKESRVSVGNCSFSSSFVASPSNVDKRNRKGETSLQVACIKGDLDKVVSLLELGSDPNSKDNAGWTPLHEAVNKGFVDVVRVLLEHKAFVNMPGCDNETPLHDAVKCDRVDCAELLLENGADPDLADVNGYTPRQLCVSDDMRSVLAKTKPRITRTAASIVESTSNLQDPMKTSVTLLPTVLDSKQKKLISELAKMLGGTMVSSSSPEVTHVITPVGPDNTCPRTMKYLEGVALGRWIVSFEWVEQCAGTKMRVPEEPFEVCGTVRCANSLAPRLSRLNRWHGLPPLFNGCHFYFTNSFTNDSNPSKDELVKLVSYAGGSILTREPKDAEDFVWQKPYHTRMESNLGKCSIFVVVCVDNHKFKTRDYSRVVESVSVVTGDYIMDCLATFKLMDLPR